MLTILKEEVNKAIGTGLLLGAMVGLPLMMGAVIGLVHYAPIILNVN